MAATVVGMCHAPNCLINADWLIICVLLTCCTLYCRSTCGKSSISACKTRTPRTTKRSPPSPSPSPAAVNVSAFLFYFFELLLAGQMAVASSTCSPPHPIARLLLWLCWDSNEYFSASVAGRQQSTANTIIAAGEHLVSGRVGETFAFRFFCWGIFKKVLDSCQVWSY